MDRKLPSERPTHRTGWGGTPARRALYRGLRVISLLVMVVGAAWFAFWAVGPSIGYWQFERRIARLKADGEPVSLHEVIPKIPPGEKNAADLYQKAFDSLQTTEEEVEGLLYAEDLGPHGDGTRDPGAWEPAEERAAREILRRDARYFALLEEASRTPVCAFSVDWKSHPKEAVPHYQELRAAGRMLMLRAATEAREGRGDDAAASVATLLRMADHVAAHPTAMALLPAYFLRGMAVTSLRHVLSCSPPSPEGCRRLLQQVATLDLMGESLTAARADRVTVGIPEIRAMREGRSLRDEERGEMAKPERMQRILGGLGGPFYITVTSRQIELLERPWRESRSALEEVDFPESWLPFALAGTGIAPLMSALAQGRDRNIARLGAACIALEATVYHTDHGCYPKSLSDLAGEGWHFTTDPFTGRDYHYQQEDTGFAVWSTGADLDDDGGRERAPGKARSGVRDFDEVFRVKLAGTGR